MRNHGLPPTRPGKTHRATARNADVRCASLVLETFLNFLTEKSYLPINLTQVFNILLQTVLKKSFTKENT